MQKPCTYEESMHDVGVVILLSVTTCTVCQSAGFSSVYPISVWNCESWSTRWQDLHQLHEQGDISPPPDSVDRQEPVRGIIRGKNVEFGNFSHFLLLSLFLAYSATSLDLSAEHWNGKGHLFVTRLESQYLNTSVIMYHSQPLKLLPACRATLNWKLKLNWAATGRFATAYAKKFT